MPPLTGFLTGLVGPTLILRGAGEGPLPPPVCPGTGVLFLIRRLCARTLTVLCVLEGRSPGPYWLMA